MEKTYYCPVCGCSVKKQRDGSFYCGGGGHVFDTEEELKPKMKRQSSMCVQDPDKLFGG